METTVADRFLRNVSQPSARVSISYIIVEAPRCSEILLTENSTIRAPCAFLTVEHRQRLDSVTLNVPL